MWGQLFFLLFIIITLFQVINHYKKYTRTLILVFRHAQKSSSRVSLKPIELGK